MAREIRNRIVRPATPEEKDRHREIPRAVEEELPELKRWARDAAARHAGRVSVGTVFGEQESHIVEAIDHYAVSHALADRGAVVRVALAQLVHVEIEGQPLGQQ
jgi:hypothetical protein